MFGEHACLHWDGTMHWEREGERDSGLLSLPLNEPLGILLILAAYIDGV